MLNAYLTALQALIQAPSAPVALISTATQTTYINTARQQVAGDGECVRSLAALALMNGVSSYVFSTIGGFNAGITGVLSVREVFITGVPVLYPIPWERFSAYYLFNGKTGTPNVFAQQLQGVNGNLWFNPTPSQNLTGTLDIVGLPAALGSDSDPEAIPYPWTDAVPFYAAWLALMSLQRQADADKMYQRYLTVIARARQEATPTVLPDNLPGGAGAAMANAKTNLGAPRQG